MLPNFRGPEYKVMPGDSNTYAVMWPIQSIRIGADEQLTTFDQANFTGKSVTFHRSTPYPGNWASRIVSFRVEQLNISALPVPDTNQAPWSFLGTWEGFIMVRMSSKTGHPECYATNGINCEHRPNIDDLLPLLAGAEGFANATFPAPCGPSRVPYWGDMGYEWTSTGRWCEYANYKLKLLVSPMSIPTPHLECIKGTLGIAAVLEQGYSQCLPMSQRSGCRFFPSMRVCAAVVARSLVTGESYSIADAFDLIPCGNNKTECVEVDLSIAHEEHKGFSLQLIVGIVGGVVVTLSACGYCVRQNNARARIFVDYRALHGLE
ncbi:hypothetical protein ACHHYP_13874 [Achlya hypogyna]|uniref:Beta/gamma crystallin 'Greek key' domain-containing protein n=1 Tax=Achlya hypogyna TaxID=1202772 RepID=A0A1V9YEJ6_ACHHY|nr:hypothetical protein ACHHYP_13874 [Achlya hypogyna]